MTFYYSSVQTHGLMTSDGKKIKVTRVDIKNGKGVKTVTIKDKKGIHTNSVPLNLTEMENVKNHKFMPRFFQIPMTNVKNMKSASQRKTRHRKVKKGTRKSKK
jgi:hypothetical protein